MPCDNGIVAGLVHFYVGNSKAVGTILNVVLIPYTSSDTCAQIVIFSA